MTTPAFPRIFVYGKVSWDPSLANNFSIYDTPNARLDRSQIPAGVSLEDFRQQLPLLQQGSWNHFGTHKAIFETVKISGISTEPGTVDTTDPIVGKPVRMVGKLVDINPARDNGTQVFFDEISFGDALGRVRAKRKKRMTARFINSRGRNTSGLPIAGNASAVWEVSLPREGVEVRNFMDSDALSALETALALPENLGLSFRFHTYRTLYWRNGIDNQNPHRPKDRDELTELYGRGFNFSNPAYSIVCGVIRPWREQEHEGHPTGRLLYSTGGQLGKAIVSVDRSAQSAVLDLGETVPEVDIDLTKLDAGTLELFAEHEGQRLDLAAIDPADYDRAAYERTAGLIDIDLSSLAEADWTKVEQGNLHLAAAGHSVQEQRMVVVVEDRDTYVDEGESAAIRLRVMDRGLPAAAGSQLRVMEFDDIAGGPGQALVTLIVGINGEVQFDVPIAAPGVRYFVFEAFEAGAALPPPNPRGPSDDFHAFVRTLPNDDALEAATPDDQLTWNFIYNTIFAEFDVLNPVMSRSSDPAINVPLHDRAILEAKASRVKAVINKDAFEQAGYMPVTRDLSRGRRRLLQRWCELVEAGNAPPDQILVAMSFDTQSERVASDTASADTDGSDNT